MLFLTHIQSFKYKRSEKTLYKVLVKGYAKLNAYELCGMTLLLVVIITQQVIVRIN
jgi:hypothetical protein